MKTATKKPAKKPATGKGTQQLVKITGYEPMLSPDGAIMTILAIAKAHGQPVARGNFAALRAYARKQGLKWKAEACWLFGGYWNDAEGCSYLIL